jgi:hypothetical protein
MSRLSKHEMVAVAMLIKLYAATGGRPQQWRAVDLILQKAEHVDALRLAIERGWIEVARGGHSVCLTERGVRVAKPGER